jgi:hypothetical protein
LPLRPFECRSPAHAARIGQGKPLSRFIQP